MLIRTIPIAVRTHTVKVDNRAKNKVGNGGIGGHETKGQLKSPQKPDLRIPYGKRLLVFDTETTTDVYQNLRYGQAFIIEGTEHAHIDGQVVRDGGHILFYGDGVTDEEMEILKTWAKKSRAVLMSRQEFVDKILLPEILEIGSVCVGFNLPFDLSRLAVDVRTQSHGKHKDKFELLLSEDKYTPSILLEPLDSKKSFISVKFPTLPGQQAIRKHQKEGRFLDLRTLVFALTNESHSLDSACKLYKTAKQKTQSDSDGFGVISFKNLDYNYNDVNCTTLLYKKVMEEYYLHPIAETLEAGRAYSPASIGKAYYNAMGIKPLSEIQPDFSNEVLGFAMASYYGGRTECRYRGKPVKTFNTDILSMYPSVFTLQNLWSWVIASGFDVVENTDEVKTFLGNVTIEDLFKQDTWQAIPGLVQVLPDKDLLPIRGKYQGDSYQIGLNYFSSDEPLWYTLADVIACKIQTGKTPEIVKALKITPRESQASLQPVKLRGSVDVNPLTDNFFKRVIELRSEFKTLAKGGNQEAEATQQFLKTVANSTSYGVYVELNREESKDELDLEIYGLESFIHKGKDYEKTGRYYNPLIATMITGAARLILTMMQKTTENLGGSFAFCDTDSMAIIDLVNDKPEEIGEQVIAQFKSLVPYNFGEDFTGSLLQAEKVNFQDGEYYPLYCYAVSSKRYVLYNLIPDTTGKLLVVIRKASEHGLGHLLPPSGLNREQMINEVWKMNISRVHSLLYEIPIWFSGIAFARQSISKPSILRRFNRQKGIPYNKMIKPGNFMLVGYSADVYLGGNQCISEFYCRKYQSIGFNRCRNNGNCDYKLDCLANKHIVAIAPYSRDLHWSELNWQDANTGQKLTVRPNKPLSDTNPPKADVTYLRTYGDFIGSYHLHPEGKLDDNQGNICGKLSLGMLQPCFVEVKVIKHIGKETNTIGNEADLEILPDEKLQDKRLLHYEGIKQKQVKQYDIDVKQWNELRLILQEKVYPRKVWSVELGISKVYLQELLSGKYSPSPELYSKIIRQCELNNINIPEGKIPLPARIDGQTLGYIYSLDDLSKRLNVSEKSLRENLGKYIFELNRIELVDCSSVEFQNLVMMLKFEFEAKQTKEKRLTLSTLTINGRMWDKTGEKFVNCVVGVEDVTAIRSHKEKGKNYQTLQIKTLDNKFLNVIQRENELVFKLGLLPKAAKFKINEKNKWSKNGREHDYSNWYNWQTPTFIPFAKVKEHYSITMDEFEADVASGVFPFDKVKQEGRKIFVCPKTAWRTYKDRNIPSSGDGDKAGENLILRWRSEIDFEPIHTQEEVYAKRLSKTLSLAGYEEKKRFREAVLVLGGVKDSDYEYLPKWTKRKSGNKLDVMVLELVGFGFCYENANELYEAILQG